MPILFKDKSGNPLRVVCGEFDPQKYSDPMLTDGYTYEEVSNEQIEILFPRQSIKTKRQVTEMDALKEILEEELKLPKGRLQERIKEKLKK